MKYNVINLIVVTKKYTNHEIESQIGTLLIFEGKMCENRIRLIAKFAILTRMQILID